MVGVWSLSVFHLIVQLSEFRGLVQSALSAYCPPIPFVDAVCRES
jgi:hypothetical protein